jgi:hypothetical protein
VAKRNPGDAAAGYLGLIDNYKRQTIQAAREQPTISFEEFRRRVRRYRPSDLLPELASLATVGGIARASVVESVGARSWAIALAARESILWGNDFKRADVSEESLREIFNASNNILELNHEPHESTADDVLGLLVRLAYQQFASQQSEFQEVTRSHPMLVQGTSEIALEVLTDQSWTDILGAPLGQIVGATFFLQAAARVGRGWIDLAQLDTPDLLEVLKLWPRGVIERRTKDLTTTFAEFKAAYHSVRQPPDGFEQYAYNPLVKTPLIRMPDGRLLAPQPDLILLTVSPAGLYYAGGGTYGYGTAFTHDFGRLNENYVGKQLRTIDPSVAVHPEIVYRDRNQELRSVDWFVDLPGMLLMVEAKAGRLDAVERVAVQDYLNKTRDVVGKAIGQLQRSSDAIDRGHPEFAHLPAGKPRVGVVVTAEPYHLANSHLVRSHLTAATFPTLTVSLRELEHFVEFTPEELERQLTFIVNDPERSTWDLANSLDFSTAYRRNPILQAAWEAYPLARKHSSS